MFTRRDVALFANTSHFSSVSLPRLDLFIYPGWGILFFFVLIIAVVNLRRCLKSPSFCVARYICHSWGTATSCKPALVTAEAHPPIQEFLAGACPVIHFCSSYSSSLLPRFASGSSGKCIFPGIWWFCWSLCWCGCSQCYHLSPLNCAAELEDPAAKVVVHNVQSWA